MTNKKSLNQIFNIVEQKLNEGYNLVDYFLTIGVNPSIFKNTWLYESDISILNTKYKEYIKPILINKFPSFDKKLIGFDDAIIQHCFPNGFEVCKFSRQPEYKIFSILLDNNNYSISHPFKYVVCLRFYESISKYKKLFDKYKESKNITMPRDSNIISENKIAKEDEVKISKSLNSPLKKNNFFNRKYFRCNESFPKPLDTECLESDYNSSDIKLNFNFSESLLRKTEFDKHENNEINNQRNDYKKYYIPKCICLISLYPFINELSKIINIIYQYSLVEKQIYPLEKIINNLLIEVPTPPKGIYSVEYSLINEIILLQATKRNDLHVLSIDFSKLFIIFNIENLLEIFRYLMLNTKIMLFSKEITNLTPIILSLLSLLYPFYYPYSVVSILHKEAYKLIDNITPVLVGINEKYDKKFLQDNDIDINDFTLIVNIDKHELIKLEPDPNKIIKPLPELPSKYKISLMNKIINCVSEIKSNQKMVGKSIFFQQNMRRIFLEFQFDLMKDYFKFLNNDIYKHQDDGKSSLEKAFKLKEFLNKVPNEYYDFYEYFLRTQMFCDFIYKRMMPRDKFEQIDVLYFEEMLFKNKNDCILLNTNNYNFSKIYTVQKPTPLTQQQIYYFNHFNIRNKLLLNGIEITNLNNIYETTRRKSFNIDTRMLMNVNVNNIPILKNNLKIDNNDESIENFKKNNNIDNQINKNFIHKHSEEEVLLSKNNKSSKNQPLFSYIIFPKLDNEYFYKNDIKNYHIDFSMFQEVKQVDNELLSKSHLSPIEIKTNETSNYIYLLWLKLWVSTFHYQDKNEQKYRFFQMMNIIRRINQHEISVINNLFSVLVKYKLDDDLILYLYQHILYYQLIPSNFIFRTIRTLINNKKNKLKLKTFNITKYFKTLKDKLNNEMREGLYLKKYFRKRTLKSIYDTEILEEKVTFSIEENCNECDRKIDLNQFILKINDTNNDLLWAKCPYCESNYLPKLNIIFGSENNKNNRLKGTTSIVDSVILYSPKTLNYSMLENIQNNFEINVEEFKSNYNPFFWNVIWYFKMKKLPFDFILPYEKNILYRVSIGKPKDNNNNNNNNNNNFDKLNKSFQLNFCDYIKKVKEKLEFKREYWNNNDGLIICSNEIDIYIPPNVFNKLYYLKINNTNCSSATNYD